MCGEKYIFERKGEYITVYKSVGRALEDLTAAKLLAEYSLKPVKLLNKFIFIDIKRYQYFNNVRKAFSNNTDTIIHIITFN
jgi:hypothetical protein